MAAIKIDQVGKTYNKTEILKNINIDIEDGEFLVLIGPSGCGKSTLLRVISGLEKATAGRILIGNLDATNIPAKHRDIAMVFQNYALYPHMTVAQNLGFSLKMRGENKAMIEQRINKVSAILGLDTLLKRKPRQLSGGQRQRVAMGRAIVRDPQAFLFDEPLSNLDAKLRVQMRTEIKALHRRLKTTMVYVTHDQIEAMTMADRIVVMRDGMVEQLGTPLDLFDEPRNIFVASFIGSPSMNLISGGISAGSEAIFETPGGGQLPLPASCARWPGRRCIYGIRPEDLTLGSSGFSVHIDSVEPTGSDTYLVTSEGELKVTCVLRKRSNVVVGQSVRLNPAIDKVHLFDADSGERIPMDR